MGDEELKRLVAESTSCKEILRKLGVEPVKRHLEKLRTRIRKLDLDTAHFIRERGMYGRRLRWSDDQLRAAVANSESYAAAIRKLGLIPAGGNYDAVQRRIRELGLDTSHFAGAAAIARRFVTRKVIPLEHVLVADRWASSKNLKKRLFRAGLKSAACELCGWAQQARDGRIPVELDHINGDKNDNRLENLRILCPNCHSLQPTHRGLNKARSSKRNPAQVMERQT